MQAPKAHAPVHECAPPLHAAGPGPVRKAAGVDAQLKAASITRLRKAEGQVRGILRMVEEDRYCADVITQIAAVQESLRAVAKGLLKNHLEHCATHAIQRSGADAQAMVDELIRLMSKLAR